MRDLGDDTIPDQVAGIKQLGEQSYPWIEMDKIGIYGTLRRRQRDCLGHVSLSRLLQGRHR